MIKTIVVKKLGLAAYMKLRGSSVLRSENRIFTMDSLGKSPSEWEIEYANSEASKFNSCLIELNQINRTS
jgi:hypothetical protein